MSVLKTKNLKEKIVSKKASKSQISTYNLYRINGCSQNPNNIQKPIYMGFYH